VTRIAEFPANDQQEKIPPAQYSVLREKALERVLGTMHGYVGHAIPYEAGGPLHMYYFPQSDGSTVFATMQLLKPDGTGPMKSSISTHELVAFTRRREAESKCCIRVD
jgi:hypothetical protein